MRPQLSTRNPNPSHFIPGANQLPTSLLGSQHFSIVLLLWILLVCSGAPIRVLFQNWLLLMPSYQILTCLIPRASLLVSLIPTNWHGKLLSPFLVFVNLSPFFQYYGQPNQSYLLAGCSWLAEQRKLKSCHKPPLGSVGLHIDCGKESKSRPHLATIPLLASHLHNYSTSSDHGRLLGKRMVAFVPISVPVRSVTCWGSTFSSHGSSFSSLRPLSFETCQVRRQSPCLHAVPIRGEIMRLRQVSSWSQGLKEGQHAEGRHRSVGAGAYFR